SHEVIRRTLNELLEVHRQLIGQIIDGHLATTINVLVQGISVVDEDLGNLDVEMTRKVDSISEPAFRLLGQAIDQHQRHPSLVSVQQPRQVEPLANVGRHDLPELLDDATRPGRKRRAPLLSRRAPLLSRRKRREAIAAYQAY